MLGGLERTRIPNLPNIIVDGGLLTILDTESGGCKWRGVGVLVSNYRVNPQVGQVRSIKRQQSWQRYPRGKELGDLFHT